MSSEYRIVYHPAAEQELLGISDLIEAYAGPDVARRKIAEIEYVTKGLAAFPYRGSTRDGFVSGLRAIPAGDKGVVCFLIDEQERMIFIAGIGYAGSDWMSKVKKRLLPN